MRFEQQIEGGDGPNVKYDDYLPRRMLRRGNVVEVYAYIKTRRKSTNGASPQTLSDSLGPKALRKVT